VCESVCVTCIVVRMHVNVNNHIHHTTLHYAALHCARGNFEGFSEPPMTPGTTLHHTILHHITLHYTTLHCTKPHHTTLHYTVLHTLHCTRGDFERLGEPSVVVFQAFVLPESRLVGFVAVVEYLEASVCVCVCAYCGRVNVSCESECIVGA
jgi:hypothetical protein